MTQQKDEYWLCSGWHRCGEHRQPGHAEVRPNFTAPNCLRNGFVAPVGRAWSPPDEVSLMRVMQPLA